MCYSPFRQVPLVSFDGSVKVPKQQSNGAMSEGVFIMKTRRPRLEPVMQVLVTAAVLGGGFYLITSGVVDVSILNLVFGLMGWVIGLWFNNSNTEVSR